MGDPRVWPLAGPMAPMAKPASAALSFRNRLRLRSSAFMCAPPLNRNSDLTSPFAQNYPSGALSEPKKPKIPREPREPNQPREPKFRAVEALHRGAGDGLAARS